jgi:transcriptional regulator with XRE-family HTH domain
MTGMALVALRKRLKLTQVAFAEQLGVHPNTQARYERDEIAIPEPVARLAQILARVRRSPRKRRT